MMYYHCVFLSPNSAFNYVISMLHLRLLCPKKNFLLTYLSITLGVSWLLAQHHEVDMSDVSVSYLYDIPVCYDIPVWHTCMSQSCERGWYWLGFSLLYVSVLLSICQVYAWGDNDHGQQGSGTTTVNRKPALVQGLDGYKISKVACGSSHSIAWCTTDTVPTVVHEPVLFFTTKDPLGAGQMGQLFTSQ